MNRPAHALKRVQQRHRKAQVRPQLNLVALMDVFTLLVFFFLVHSSDMGEAAHSHLVNLPESLADLAPRQTIVISITKDQLLLGDTPITSVTSVLSSPKQEIVELRNALRAQREATDGVSSEVDPSTREITIMGDKSIPFRLLRKVMLSCVREGYPQISLAVLQKSGQSG